MDSFLSFRPQLDQLTLKFAKTLGSTRVQLVSQILTEVIVGVAAYREEGSRYLPIVFLTDDLKSLMKAMHGNDAMVIGEGAYHPDTVRGILKTCGPLGEGRQWAIYLLLEAEKIKFGIFRADLFPLHETSFGRLRSLNNSKLKILGVTRLGEGVVEVRSASGDFQYVDAAGSSRPHVPAFLIKKFVSKMSRDVPLRLRTKMNSFYYRLLVDVFGNAHGTLSVVLGKDAKIPPYLADGVWLTEAFGLESSINQYVKCRTESDTLSLIAHGNLIQKMMAMDGVTVFNSAGAVIGFNCFVSDPSLGRRLNGTVVGGARRRAYEILCSKLDETNDEGLVGVLYKSQDGMGECRITGEEAWALNFKNAKLKAQLKKKRSAR